MEKRRTIRLSDKLESAILKEIALSDNPKMKVSEFIRQILVKEVRGRRSERKLSDKLEQGSSILKPKEFINANLIIDSIRELAVTWGEAYHMSMIDKFKLGSDIQNVFTEFLDIEKGKFDYPSVPIKK